MSKGFAPNKAVIKDVMDTSSYLVILILIVLEEAMFMVEQVAVKYLKILEMLNLIEEENLQIILMFLLMYPSLSQ